MFEALSLLLVIAGLSVLIIIHEAGHFLVAKYFGLLVEEFGFGIPPRLLGKQLGETLVSLNWLPFGGFVKIYGEKHDDEKPGIPPTRSFSHQSVGKRALIIIAGVTMNFLLGWLLISLIFIIGTPQTVLITEVKEDSLAKAAGLLAGDQLAGFVSVDSFVKFIDKNKGKEVSLEIKRGAEVLNIKVTPRTAVPAGEGNLGIAVVESGIPKTGFFQAFWQGLITSFNLVWAILASVLKLIVGLFTDVNIFDRIVGPVGIVNVAIQTAKLGIVNLLQLIALISLNLAVFNVLPIPALDGGRLLFILVEKIKGSPIPVRTELVANSLGFALLVFLIFAVTIKDILTLL
jgi:regulator of sigma E protease